MRLLSVIMVSLVVLGFLGCSGNDDDKIVNHDPQAKINLIGAHRKDKTYEDHYTSFAIRDNYVFFGGDSLRVLSIQNPAQPSLVCASSIPGNGAGDIFIYGNNVYLATGLYGLQVADVQTPSNSHIIGGNFSSLHGANGGITVRLNYAFLGNHYNGIAILDISDPSSPDSVIYFDTPGRVRSVALDGDFLYVADGDSGLQVIDISNILAPAIVANYPTTHNLRNIHISDGFAYLSLEDSGMVILNITNPSQPMLVGSYNTDGGVADVFVRADYAYLADWDKGLTILDVTDKTNPTFIENWDSPETWGGLRSAEWVFVDENYIYLLTDLEGFFILEFTP